MKYTVAEFRKNTREILNAVDQGADVYIQRYDSLYRINKSTMPSDTLPMIDEGEAEFIKGNSIVVPKAAIKELKKNKSIGKPIKKKAVPAGVAPVDSCPHGFAKGFCKKVDCNRRYQK